MKIEHKLSPAHQQHCREVLAQIDAQQQAILRLEGEARQREREIATMRKHLGVLVGLVEKAEHLPPSLTPYELSADGTALIGEAEEPKGVPSGVAE